MKRLFISILSFIILVSTLLPTIFVVAQESGADLAPNNPLCWTKEACQEQRKKMAGDSFVDSSDGWVQDYPCIGEYGKCLPTGVTKTQISFGGENKFTDAGQYIKKVYDYSIVIIGIIAVLVIIIAGIQWITSAGNSDAISSSQKRIKGAVIGLLIAYMSFNILSSINPATTSLRLPQVWMVSGDELQRGAEVLEGDYCDPSGKDGETMAACEKDGTKKCFKVVRSDGWGGFCYYVAVVISIIASGGTAAPALLGTAAGATAMSALGISARAGVTVIKATTRVSFKIIKKLGYKGVKATVKGAVKGAVTAGGAAILISDDTEFRLDAAKFGAGIVAVGAVKGVSTIYDYMTDDEEDDFKEYRNGICLDKIKHGLKNGQICNTEGDQCLSGVCLSLDNDLDCWQSSVNGEMGICSDGSVGNICNSDSDCNTKTNPKIECRKTRQGLKYCSDGSVYSGCTENSQCDSNICSEYVCVSHISSAGEWCTNSKECSDGGSCIAISNCTATREPYLCGFSCKLWDLKKDKLSDKKDTGMCFKQFETDQIEKLEKKYKDAGFAPATERGIEKCSGY